MSIESAVERICYEFLDGFQNESKEYAEQSKKRIAWIIKNELKKKG